MTTASVVARLRNVSRDFSDGGGAPVHAVRDVNLELPAGTLTLVTGPSGSGKTTLLSMVGGLLSPTSGEVEVNGQPMASFTQGRRTEFRLRNVGFVFQRFRLLDALTAQENIELPLAMRGVRRPESRDRARELAKRVGFGKDISMRVHAMSAGEQQRIAVARALANEPPLLLADEPTGSLDSQTGQRIIELLHDVAKSGVAVLVASHDLRLEPYADAIVRLEDGRARTA